VFRDFCTLRRILPGCVGMSEASLQSFGGYLCKCWGFPRGVFTPAGVSLECVAFLWGETVRSLTPGSFTRVEIIITIGTAIHIRNNKNFGSHIRAILHVNCYYNFNPCGIFQKMTSFSQILNQDLEQGKLMVVVNSWK